MSRRLPAVLLLPVALLVGCATTDAPRDGTYIARLTPAEAQRLGVTLPTPLTIDQIIQMSKDRVPPERIIERMKDTASVYRLNSVDVQKLRDGGVAEQVIENMTSTKDLADKVEEDRRYSHTRRGPFYDPFWGPFWGPWGPWDPWYRWPYGPYPRRFVR